MRVRHHRKGEEMDRISSHTGHGAQQNLLAHIEVHYNPWQDHFTSDGQILVVFLVKSPLSGRGDRRVGRTSPLGRRKRKENLCRF